MDSKIDLLKFAQTIAPTSSINDLEKTYRRLLSLLTKDKKKITSLKDR